MSSLFFKTSFDLFCCDSKHPIKKHPTARVIFMTMCGMANCFISKQATAQGILLTPGQLVTSVEQLTEETGLTTQQVRTALKWLESGDAGDARINKRSNKQGTIVTIENWEKICGVGQPPNKRDNNIIESISSSSEEEKHTPKPKPEPKPADPEEEALAQQWLDYAVSEKPHLKGKLKLGDYTAAVHKLRALDGHELAVLGDVLAFVRQDDFWRDKALSPIALRTKSKNGLPKIDNVISAMRRPGAVKPKKKAITWINQDNMKELLGIAG